MLHFYLFAGEIDSSTLYSKWKEKNCKQVEFDSFILEKNSSNVEIYLFNRHYFGKIQF
jgi:hypothetical protein